MLSSDSRVIYVDVITALLQSYTALQYIRSDVPSYFVLSNRVSYRASDPQNTTHSGSVGCNSADCIQCSAMPPLSIVPTESLGVAGTLYCNYLYCYSLALFPIVPVP